MNTTMKQMKRKTLINGIVYGQYTNENDTTILLGQLFNHV